MNNKIFNFLFVFLILSFSSTFLNALNWDMYSIDKNVFVGNIIFPKQIKTIPTVSLYRRGLKIKTEKEAHNNKIQFTIDADKSFKTFYLLIAKEVTPDIDDNTVNYLTIDTTEAYKFYKLNLFVNHETAINPKTRTEEIKETYFWNIQKMQLDSKGILPDDTLIMLFNPDYVEKLEGGSNLELPKIILSNNILQKAGSEKKFIEETNELLLSSLDLNIIHSKPESREFRTDKNKKLIVAMNKAD